jgi:gas vesicle protein
MKFACAGLLFRALVVKASPNLDIFFFVFAGTCVGLVAAAQRAPQSGTRPRPQSRTSSQSA